MSVTSELKKEDLTSPASAVPLPRNKTPLPFREGA